MKKHFISKLIKVSVFLLHCISGCFYGMDLSKKVNNPEERFLNSSFNIVSTSKIGFLCDDDKKAVQKEIVQNKNQNMIRLFNVGTLPSELQKKIMLIFCENSGLADECLRLPIRAIHDRKWAYDVMAKETMLHLRNIINEHGHLPGYRDVIFSDQKNVFSLAKEIQDFEKSHQKNFADLSVHNLLAIKAIIDTFSSKRSSCLSFYSNNRSATCNIRKKVTWQRFEKNFTTWLKKDEFMAAMFIAMGTLIIKSVSRLEELFFCEKIIKEDVINFNKIAEAVNNHLRLSKDPLVRGYYVWPNPAQDYSDFDYIKIYASYLLFLPYIPKALDIIDCYIYGNTKLIYVCGMFASIIFALKLDRESVLAVTALIPAAYISLCSLLTILSIKLKTKKTVMLNEISDLLKRTDIEIVS